MMTSFHQSEHYSFSKNRIVKFLIAAYGSWMMDPYTWRARHHYSHHVYTNVLGYDADVGDNYMTHRSLPNAPFRKWMGYSYYYYVFYAGVTNFPLIILVTLALIFGKKITMKFNRKYDLDLVDFWFFLALKWLGFYLLCIRPFYVFSFWKALLFATYFPFVMSLQIKVLAAANHLTEATTHMSRNEQFFDESWAKHQIITSTNFCNFKDHYTNSLSDWCHYVCAWIAFTWSGGTNYQIEHHIFPSLCNDILVEIAPIVRAICAKHGVFYPHFDGWWAILGAHVNHIHSLNVAPA